MIDEYTIDLTHIYEDRAQINAFNKRLNDFVSADPYSEQLIKVDGNALTYKSESYIPDLLNRDKQTVAFILGNPAPESIAIKALFAYENSGKRYHRFWNVLELTGVLEFDRPASQVPPDEKMQKIFSNDFSSPLNVCIMPFYSFATPPGGKWGGVAGLKRLFGKAFPAISTLENERIHKLLDSTLGKDDTALIFQKDAYTTMQSQHEWPQYSYSDLLTQPIEAELALSDGVAHVKCLLPTRLLHSAQTKRVLQHLRGHPLEK